MGSETNEIIEAAANHLPNLFELSVFGLLLKEESTLYLYQEESCPPSFTQEVAQNMVKVISILGEEPNDLSCVTLKIEKKKLLPPHTAMDPKASLKSYLVLPLAVEGEIIGCVSINSDQPNVYDAQALQFFSVIGYQLASTLKQFQRFSSIKTKAIYDNLTNLYNRQYFEEKLITEVEKSFQEGSPLSLIMVDIDHFKKVNDTFGHPEGDKVLREIASLLKASVREKDTVARYGGEEFVLILPDAGIQKATIISERIRRKVESTPFEVGETHTHITVSLGISNFPDHHPKSKGDLVKMADQALYDAKREGRNRVRLFHPARR